MDTRLGLVGSFQGTYLSAVYKPAWPRLEFNVNIYHGFISPRIHSGAVGSMPKAMWKLRLQQRWYLDFTDPHPPNPLLAKPMAFLGTPELYQWRVLRQLVPGKVPD